MISYSTKNELIIKNELNYLTNHLQIKKSLSRFTFSKSRPH